MDTKIAEGIWGKVKDQEHPHAACVAMMQGKVDDPHAFCTMAEKQAAGTTPAERMAMKKHEQLRSLKGAEIFSAGKHNGDEYSDQDLDDIVEAFNALDYRPALKLGHSSDPGHPAYGYVANLRRVGSKLIADFVDLTDKVYDAIRGKHYDRVSSEIYWNMERSGRKYRRALKAVALLGSEVPAVAGLTPLSTLFAANTGEVRAYDVAASLRWQQQSSDMKGDATMSDDATLKDMQAKLAASEDELKAAKDKQAETDAKLTELSEKLAKLANVAGGDLDSILKNIQSDEDRAKLAEMSATIKARDTELANAKAAAQAAETKLTETMARVSELSDRQRRAKIDAVVGACKIPALREFVYQYLDVTTRDQDIKVYSLGGQRVDPNTAAETFIKFVNQNALGLFKEESRAGDAAEYAENASAEVSRRAKEYLRQHSLTMKDYEKARDAVLEADPALKAEFARPRHAA